MSELDDAFNAADSLEPDDRLRLIARVWASLPEEFWAAPSASDRADVRAMLAGDDTDRMAGLPRRIARQVVGVPPTAPAAKIYSAPRRFDLATIFVVTFAYSLLFAVMSGFRFPPATSAIVGAFITLVGAGQALLFGGKRPRTASILTGAGLGVLGSIAFWMFVAPALMRQNYLAIMTFNFCILGSICGYVAGVMVGGVFLIADAIRQWFVRRGQNSHEVAVELVEHDLD